MAHGGNFAFANLTEPVGLIIPWPTETVPTGYLECDGSAVSRSVYAALFAVIGTIYGPGDGSTTFNLPDLRGRFPRGWDHGAGLDPDAGSRADRGDGTTGDHVGTKQADEHKSHGHEYYKTDVGSQPDWGGGSTNPYGIGAENPTGRSVAPAGGNETRAININVMWCIKY